MRKVRQVIWIRLGDQGDYLAHHSLEAAAHRLWSNGVREIFRGIQYGVTSSYYFGNDYISLYYGPNRKECPDADRELTDQEIAHINKLLGKLT